MFARFLAALAFGSLCLTVSVNAAPAGSFLIVPGHSIGHLVIGPNGAAELRHLPRADAGDAAMMQSNLVWLSKTSGRSDTLYIHTISNAAVGLNPVPPSDGLTISEIRITSRQFHTQNGISTASTLAQIERRFPDARADRFMPAVYNDSKHGIAFEFALPVTPASRCRAISVLPPGPNHAVTPQSEVDDLLKNSHT